MRALRNIKEGDVISLGYVDLSASTASRRKELSKSYYFYCQCSRCCDSIDNELLEALVCSYCSGPLLVHDKQADGLDTWGSCCKCSRPETKESVHGWLSDLDKLVNNMRVCTPSLFLSVATQLLELNNRRLWACNRQRCSIGNEIMNKAISLCNWKVAQAAAEDSLLGYKLSYPRNSPVTGLQYALAGM